MKTSSHEYTSLLKQRYLPGRSLYLKYLIYPRILKRLKKGSLLDMGCGFGEFLKYLNNKGRDCLGVDSNALHVEICNGMGLHTQVGNILHFSAEKKYENAILDNVLEHLDQDEINQFFTNVKNLLAANGRLVVIVPCSKGQSRDPTHKTYITEELIRQSATKHKMKLVEVVHLPTPFEFIGKYFYLQMRMFVLDMQA